MRLTLGALAELEAELGEGFAGGPHRTGSKAVRCRAGMFCGSVVAGLRGGGWRGRMEDLLAVEIAGGPLEGRAARRRASGAGLRATGS